MKVMGDVMKAPTTAKKNSLPSNSRLVLPSSSAVSEKKHGINP
jgi:hypothetical protein